MRSVSIVIFVSFLCICVKGDCEDDEQMRDNATLDYLKLEQDLWIKLTNSANDDKDYLFALVRDEHKRFMRYSGRLAYGDGLFELPSTQNLKNILTEVRECRNELNYREITLDFDKIDKAKNLSEAITREINRFDFWKDGTNYLDHCNRSEYIETIEAPYQKVYQYYHQSVGALLQTYIFTQLSYMLKCIREDKEPGKNILQPSESLVALDKFKHSIKSVHQSASIALQDASRDIWNCRRNKYSPGCVSCSRFDALMNFLQGFIDNKINLNEDGTCKKSCTEHTKTKQFGCANGTMCSNTEFVRESDWDIRYKITRGQTMCYDDVRDCRDIAIEGSIIVNYAKENTWRYNYIEFNDTSGERIFGADPDKFYGLNLTASTWRDSSGECSNCYCFCDVQSNSIRYFSLQDVVSSIYENKAVVGLQIFTQNGVVQLAIWEAPLRPRGQASYGSKVTSEYEFRPQERRPVNGFGYFTMTYENRSINLDDVVVPAGQVVTGVRFTHRNGHVLLEVRGTDFDYAKGRLRNHEESKWYSNEDGGKHEVQLPNRLNPFESHNVGKVYVPQSFEKDAYVQFVPSDFESDLGQIMVPLIEADSYDPVKSRCPTALSGIGLTYVNDEERTTAGAIIPKLIVYEFPIPSIDDLILE